MSTRISHLAVGRITSVDTVEQLGGGDLQGLRQLGVIHTHIVTGWPRPLIELLGPLMGLVAAQYLPALTRRRIGDRAGGGAGAQHPGACCFSESTPRRDLAVARLGERLVAKHSAGAGKRNAWWLTSHGEEISRALQTGADRQIGIADAGPARVSRVDCWAWRNALTVAAQEI